MSVVLRVIEKEDLRKLRDWRNEPWLRLYVREYRLLTMVDQEKWFEYITTSREVAMFGVMLNRELVGVCGLTNISWVNRTAEVSLYVIPEARKLGVGAAVLGKLKQVALEEYNLRRLWAEIYDFNEASIALFEAAGYVLEGTLQQHIFKRGSYHDSLMYGRLLR